MKTIYNGHSTKSGVYVITNQWKLRYYVGSAKEFKSRYKRHLASLRKGTHHNKFLQNDFNRCGEAAFVFEVLEVVPGEQSERLAAEQRYLDSLHDSQEDCYNFDKKSEGSSRSCFSKTPEETRKLISENGKRLWSDPDFKKKTLKKLRDANSTPEARKRMQVAQKASWNSEERRKETSNRMHKRWSSVTKNDRRAALSDTILSEKSIKKRVLTQRETFELKRQVELASRSVVRVVQTYGTKEGANRVKTWNDANLLSPDGVLYVNITNLRRFAVEHGLNGKDAWKLQQVVENSRFAHKGWVRFYT